MVEEIQKLESRLTAMEERLGLPKRANTAMLARLAADKRRTILAPKESAVATELRREIKALAAEKGLLAEFTIWELGSKGNPAACCWCFCCL